MKNIQLDLEPPIATITLDRPEVRNAISPGLVHDTWEALDQILEEEGISGVVVTGRGKAFSGGADLSSLKQMTEQSVEDSRQDSIEFMEFFRRIYEFPKPVVAAVNGPAIGGGCGLASVCDMVVASEKAKFGYTELRVGFIPALVSVFLTRICGDKKARDLLFTARIFDAREALEIGIVNYVVEPDQVMEKARELVQQMSLNSPVGLTFTKELLRDVPALSLDDALAEAVQYNSLIRTTDDFKEGVTAFLEKRPPIWKRR